MVRRCVPVSRSTVKRKFIQDSANDKAFYIIIYGLLGVICLLMLYPLVYIISSSFSSAAAVSAGKVVMLPVDPTLDGYKAVFQNSDIWIGYRNTIFYTVFGTVINVAMTLIAAYPLSQRDLPGKGLVMFLFTFTMLFNGGMIPNFILIRDLKMINTVWAMLIPNAIIVYNMIITRTYIQNNIPEELSEAARIDGCNEFVYFFAMVVPLSKAVIAVITLYYAVAHWNAYFSAFLYLSDKELFPLQLFLRDILIANTIDPSQLVDPELMAAKQGMADLLKYALIVVSTVPIMCIYPFVQKYFIKGVMIGSIKG